MHRKFGKKDVIFIGALLGICLIVLGVWYFAGGKQGALVVVTREGEVYGTYSLTCSCTEALHLLNEEWE